MLGLGELSTGPIISAVNKRCAQPPFCIFLRRLDPFAISPSSEILGLWGSFMTFQFFAFGSFSREQVHFPKISNFICSEKQAFVRGSLYRLRCGYPALIPEESGDFVQGTLYELEAPESFWPVLDGLLGVNFMDQTKCFFNRQSVGVHMGNFGQSSAYTYCLNPKKLVSAHKKITGGDWQKNLYQDLPINFRLQERQKEYLYKLSKSKGRDIVPIKLDLYRELMNLELIADRGRRLALTPLGKETAFFIG